jgi:glycosyltransferase involved in cell wall biosynthesis
LAFAVLRLPLKIGFLGNANNYPFMLARAMRKLGHDVEFIVSGNSPLDRPENRYPEYRSGYPKWLHEVEIPNPLDWIGTDYQGQRQRAGKILSGCDCIILNQLAPSLASSLKKPAIVLLTGTDLVIYGDYRTATFQAEQVVSRTRMRRWARSQLTRLKFRTLIKRQRLGIRNAVCVSFFSRGVSIEGDTLLDGIGVTDDRRVYLMMTEVDLLAPTFPPEHLVTRVFCGFRHNWVRPVPRGSCEIDYKGSDIMVKGLGLFFRRTAAKLDLRLVRKGMHVKETAALIEQEGISDQATWLDELDQIAYLDECRQADIVFDQLGKSTFGMVTLDAMALGRPVIANGRPEIFGNNVEMNPPICQAASPEEVADQLERLVSSRDERLRIGKRSREFVERYFSPEHAAKVCLDRFTAALGK